MAIRRRIPSARAAGGPATVDVETDQSPNLADPSEPSADETEEEGETEDVGETEETEEEEESEEAAKPWVGQRDPSVPLSPEDNAAILAHEERVWKYNNDRRQAGLSEALTKEEQDRVP